MSLADVREAFRRRDVRYEVTVQHGKGEIRTKLRTRRLI
jgi:hypothetical protein